MVGRLDFAVFVVGALMLHVAALAAFGPGLSTSTGQEARSAHALKAADPELAALVELWNTPPETGAASDLAGPGEDAPPPDTTDAAQAEAGVDAASEVAALGEVSGPGKAAVRPVFAPKINTPTTAPARVIFDNEGTDVATSGNLGDTVGSIGAIQSSEPPRLGTTGLRGPATGDSGLSIGQDGGDTAPGSSLAGLGSSGGIGGGLAALPTQPLEVTFAPEAAPVPSPRPDAETLAALLAAQPDDEEQPSIVVEGAPPPEDAPGPSLSGGLGAPALPGGGLPSSPGGALPSLPSLPDPEPAEN